MSIDKGADGNLFIFLSLAHNISSYLGPSVKSGVLGSTSHPGRPQLLLGNKIHKCCYRKPCSDLMSKFTGQLNVYIMGK